jgi:Uncharacterised nucleotidyltransferase
MALSPNFRLAAACAIWPPSDRRSDAIRAAASEVHDWPRFLRVARRHRVVGLVHDGLTRARPAVPPAIASEIGAASKQMIYESLAMADEALRLQRLFNEAELPVLFVKGASLAMLAFDTVGLSSGQDIDLLVPLKALPKASAIVMEAGYRRYDPPPAISDAQLRLLLPLRRDFGFIHEATGIQLEVHWRLFLNPYAMAEDTLMANSRVVPLAGTRGLRTLGEEDLFAYLCMHGALHWWHRLKWLADINALLGAPGSDVERLIGSAKARGAGRAAAQALRICQRLLGTSLPDRFMASLGNSALERWLETTALNAMTKGQGEDDPHEARFGTTRGSLSTFLLSRNWRYWLAEMGYHLTNQTDVLMVPLPERLRFLYPILRLPLWAWRHAKRK